MTISVEVLTADDFFNLRGIDDVIKAYAKEDPYGVYKDRQVDVNTMKLDYLYSKEDFECFALFDDGQFIGGAIFGYGYYAHYKQKFAWQDSLFIKREYRKNGTAKFLMDFLKRYLKEKGCEFIQFSAPHNSRLEKVFSRLYEHSDSIFVCNL